MPILDVQLKDVPDDEFLPAGDYVFKIAGVPVEGRDFTDTKDQLKVRLVVEEGPSKGVMSFYDVDMDNLIRIRQLFRAAGVNPDTPNTDLLQDKLVAGTVSNYEKRDGSPGCKVRTLIVPD